MADSRLNDGKFYGFNIKKHLRYIQHSQTINHQLRIIFSIHLYSFSQFQIDNMNLFIRDNHHICRTKTILYMKAQIYFLFHGKHRIRADMLCFFYLFNHILNIFIYSFQKFIAVVIGSWSSASNLQVLLYQMLRQLMPCCTFSSIRTFFIWELFL